MIEKGKQYEIEITDMGREGEGIGKLEGAAVFVPSAVPGDIVQVEITQVQKNFLRGKVIEIKIPSKWRRTSPCPYGKSCGGCGLSSLSYEGQLALKEKWVRDRLERLGSLEAPEILPIIGMTSEAASDAASPEKHPVRYRNKVQMAIGRVTGQEKKEKGCRVGFYRPKSHEVVDCEDCLLQMEPALRIAQVVREYVKHMKVPIYDPKSGTGLLRSVVVKTAAGTGEIMVILVASEKRIPDTGQLVQHLNHAIELLVDELWSENPECDMPEYSLESVILNVNKRKGYAGSVLGEENITIAGKATITDHLCGLDFEISPLSFYQVNPVQMEKLYKKVLDYADLRGEETVLDLYCGVGAIGLYLSRHAGKVIGIESVRAAVLDANRNAVINSIVNAEFIHGKAEEVLTGMNIDQITHGKGVDIIVLDPPRQGCDPALLKAAVGAGPQKIIYVSCDPATLARDVKILGEEGYRFVEAQPVDMFPDTVHVEAVALLEKITH